jgi:hypothetical protein
MQKHELKARLDGQMSEWKRNLDVMQAKVETATGDAKVTYAEQVAGLQKQYNDLSIKAAAAWDTGDEKWADVSRDLESAWDDWSDRAMKSWTALTK